MGWFCLVVEWHRKESTINSAHLPSFWTFYYQNRCHVLFQHNGTEPCKLHCTSHIEHKTLTTALCTIDALQHRHCQFTIKGAQCSLHFAHCTPHTAWCRSKDPWQLTSCERYGTTVLDVKIFHHHSLFVLLSIVKIRLILLIRGTHMTMKPNLVRYFLGKVFLVKLFKRILLQKIQKKQQISENVREKNLFLPTGYTKSHNLFE